MDINGEAIHGTVGSPFSELSWGRATQKFHGKSTTIYLHIFDWPSDGKLVVPGLAGRVKKAKVLGGNHATFTMGDGEVTVNVPSEMPNDHIGVVAIEVQGKPVVYEAPSITAPANEFVSSLEVTLSVGSDDLTVRYWLNNNRHLMTYSSPIVLDETTTINAQSFDGAEAVSTVVSSTFTKVAPWQPSVLANHIGGLDLKKYEGTWDELPKFPSLSPSTQSHIESIPEAPEQEFVAWVFDGYLNINEDAMYEFALTSDDGSRLLVNDIVVIDNDGLHGTQEKSGSAPLAEGLHKFRVEWFNKSGGASLQVKMGLLGGVLTPVTASSFAVSE